MSFWEIIRAMWPIAVTIASIAVTTFAWFLKSQYVTKADAANEKARVTKEMADQDKVIGAMDARLQILEKLADEPPSRMQMLKEIHDLAARMTGVEREVEATNNHLKTTNSYLSTLVERAMDPTK